jgi:O-antigen ligase
MYIPLLLLIFLRPFISSLAFVYVNLIYSYFFIGAALLWFFSKKRAGFPEKEVSFPLVIFLLAVALSLSFSSYKINGVKELYGYFTSAIIFLFAFSLTQKENEQLRTVLSASAFAIGILAIYQYFFGFRHVLEYMQKEGVTNEFALDYLSRRRVFFPFVTPNILGVYLAMCIFLVPKNRSRLAVILPLAIALLLTKSLGAIISILLASLVVLYCRKHAKKKELAICIGIICAAIIIFFLRSSQEGTHRQPLFSGLMRFNYWQETISLVKQHPLLGVGPGNFNLPESRYAHNSYLQLWAETGLLGLASFLWLAWAILRKGLKEESTILTVFLIFLFHNLIDFSFFLPEVSFIWWLAGGLIVGKTKKAG